MDDINNEGLNTSGFGKLFGGNFFTIIIIVFFIFLLFGGKKGFRIFGGDGE